MDSLLICIVFDPTHPNLACNWATWDWHYQVLFWKSLLYILRIHCDCILSNGSQDQTGLFTLLSCTQRARSTVSWPLALQPAFCRHVLILRIKYHKSSGLFTYENSTLSELWRMIFNQCYISYTLSLASWLRLSQKTSKASYSLNIKGLMLVIMLWL